MNARIRPTEGGPTERPVVEGGKAIHPGDVKPERASPQGVNYDEDNPQDKR